MSQTYRLGTRATSVFTDDNGMTNVVYHSTAVVKFDSKKIILSSGGWHTNTTKTRMNQASNQYGLGFNVYQKDFAWFVDFKGKTHDFEDGLTLDR